MQLYLGLPLPACTWWYGLWPYDRNFSCRPSSCAKFLGPVLVLFLANNISFVCFNGLWEPLNVGVPLPLDSVSHMIGVLVPIL